MPWDSLRSYSPLLLQNIQHVGLFSFLHVFFVFDADYLNCEAFCLIPGGRNAMRIFALTNH